jgi:hypothetical protein
VTDETPAGAVHVPVPAVNVMTQSLPRTDPEAVTPETVGVQVIACAEGEIENEARIKAQERIKR